MEVTYPQVQSRTPIADFPCLVLSAFYVRPMLTVQRPTWFVRVASVVHTVSYPCSTRYSRRYTIFIISYEEHIACGLDYLFVGKDMSRLMF